MSPGSWTFPDRPDELSELSGADAWARLERGEALEQVFIPHLTLPERASLGHVHIRDCVLGVFEATDAVGRGMFELTNCRITDRFELSGGRFEDTVRIQGSELAVVRLRGAHLGARFELVDCRVTRESIFVSVLADDFFRFDRSEFDGEVYLGECQFAQELHLANCDYNGPMHIDGCHVQAPLEAVGARFASGLSIVGCQLDGWCDLESSASAPELVMRQTTFARGLDLGDARVARALRMDRVTVEGDVHGRGLVVEGDLDVARSTFQGQLELRGSEIGSDLTLAQTRLARSLIGSALSVGHSVRIEGTQLTEDLDIRGARIGSDLTVADTRIGGSLAAQRGQIGGSLALLDSAVGSTLDADRGTIDGTLDIRPGSTVSGLRLAGLDASDVRVELDLVDGHLVSERTGAWDTAYEEWRTLRRVWERHGETGASDLAYMRIRQMARRARTGTYERLWGAVERLLVDWGTGYGTRPLRVLGLSAAVIAGFACVYLVFAGTILCDGGTTCDLTVWSIGERLSRLLYFSTVTFTTLGYGDLSPALDSWIKHLVAVEAFTGAFLMALFAGTVARKVIRQ